MSVSRGFTLFIFCVFPMCQAVFPPQYERILKRKFQLHGEGFLPGADDFALPIYRHAFAFDGRLSRGNSLYDPKLNYRRSLSALADLAALRENRPPMFPTDRQLPTPQTVPLGDIPGLDRFRDRLAEVFGRPLTSAIARPYHDIELNGESIRQGIRHFMESRRKQKLEVARDSEAPRDVTSQSEATNRARVHRCKIKRSKLSRAQKRDRIPTVISTGSFGGFSSSSGFGGKNQRSRTDGGFGSFGGGDYGSWGDVIEDTGPDNTGAGKTESGWGNTVRTDSVCCHVSTYLNLWTLTEWGIINRKTNSRYQHDIFKGYHTSSTIYFVMDQELIHSDELVSLSAAVGPYQNINR